MAEMVELRSSNLAAAEYDGETLVVTFRNGGRYAYDNVPRATFEALKAAPSPGSYFASAIRNVFPTRRL